ncbi:MAG: aminoglycoside phosphotransferase family protein [Candidatus Promineifilaceae bacterium]|nr:aminoglycoside phosphotransferase family protein [Candidatus Promineifilaceae bacterium]
MTLSEQYVDQIGRIYPHLSLESVELLAGGQYNDVLLVNEAVLFRFPKVPSAVTALKREVAVLSIIHPLLPLPVPEPLYVNGQNQGVGAAFMGYPRLPGESLWRADLEAIRDETILARMARQLAEFLLALHDVPLAEFDPAAVPVEDDRTSWSGLYHRIREHLYPHMRPEARQRTRDTFTTFLDDPALASFEPTLRHGDFGAGNVLWEPESGTITGIIDFGSVAIGNPAIDLASLAAGFGDTFLEHCARHYPVMPEMRPRMAFYRSTFALQEALFGAENDDPVAFAAGMAGYT